MCDSNFFQYKRCVRLYLASQLPSASCPSHLDAEVTRAATCLKSFTCRAALNGVTGVPAPPTCRAWLAEDQGTIPVPSAASAPVL